MTKAELLLFLTENKIDHQWRENMLLAWIPFWAVQDFTYLCQSYISNGGAECNLQEHGFICIDLVPLCDFYGIKPEKILKNAE